MLTITVYCIGIFAASVGADGFIAVVFISVAGVAGVRCWCVRVCVSIDAARVAVGVVIVVAICVIVVVVVVFAIVVSVVDVVVVVVVNVGVVVIYGVVVVVIGVVVVDAVVEVL